VDRPEVTLRVAVPADEADVRAVMHASAAAIFPRYYDERQSASAVRYVAEPDPQLLADGTYFVLEAGGAAIACGGWSRRRKPYVGSAAAADDLELLDPATEAAHVRAMFVHPAWTRRGLGRRIIEACEAAAAGEGFRRLDLVATLPGIELYEACGFVPTADVEDVVLVDGVRLPCRAMSKAVAGG
jgi:GNAT superfamily N-acetyltransferase